MHASSVTYMLRMNNSVMYLFTDMSQIKTMLQNEVSLAGGGCISGLISFIYTLERGHNANGMLQANN